MNPRIYSNFSDNNNDNNNQINYFINMLSPNLTNNLIKIFQNPFNISTHDNKIDNSNYAFQQNLYNKKEDTSILNNISKNKFQINRNRKIKDNSIDKVNKLEINKNRYDFSLKRRKQNLNNYLFNFRLNTTHLMLNKNNLNSSDNNQFNKDNYNKNLFYNPNNDITFNKDNNTDNNMNFDNNQNFKVNYNELCTGPNLYLNKNNVSQLPNIKYNDKFGKINNNIE